MTMIKSIAFDLDDTLVDTSGLLVPMASQRACEAMIAAGVCISLEECMRIREELAANLSHTEIFTKIANQYGTNTPGKAVHDALEMFYNPEVPPVLPLLAGATENLLHLKEQYNLYLVTMGSYEAQVRKIQALGVEKFFKKIYILNGFIGEKKESAFQDILAREGHSPDELISIGNRLSSEIRDGKRVGARTCYFAHGEHIGEQPVFPEDHPDFTITQHKDLITVCGL
ncbi:HAD hydrolase-like protein [Bdellovibrio sp. KM01]|uniref:HAD hydrolase-like protein n=1 Tax=Bdellovibrio sp. KM01 TaxID=2748865 RepID=UPI0015EA53BD|nr:HAD hydrolase-like protein [Bdellovibrio sp. KM01]QLY25072.1 HAD hydrolase-like protein [Bdellovibrio sp. KM01]